MVESMKNHKENTQKIKVMIDGSEKKRWTSWDMGKEHFEKWPGKKWDMYHMNCDMHPRNKNLWAVSPE